MLILPPNNSARRAEAAFFARLAKEFRRRRDRARLESAWLSITEGCSRCSQGPAARPCGRCPIDLRGTP
jgi:hypothetical protein